MALEVCLVLNELVAVLIGWRGFHLGRRNASWLEDVMLRIVDRIHKDRYDIFVFEMYLYVMYIYISVECWDI